MKGHEIIKDVMRQYKIGPKDFFGHSRLPRLVRARRVAARRMFEANISVSVIARLMQRHPRTVAYHVDPGQRERSLARSARYYAAHCDERRPYWVTSYRRKSEAMA
jgi:chromosomal replication initiation ATPase DnaA